ncbi:hypothetical protein H9P43_001798 [Blastocladiella emersonii ATCC 22665]|nr:hypothetical protein H9P43_001798 [Blastocladiella emersonii ATCC 22665]
MLIAPPPPEPPSPPAPALVLLSAAAKNLTATGGGSPDLTPSQLAALVVILRIGTVASVVLCVAMLVDVARRWASFRHSPHRIVITWTFADLLACAAFWAARGPAEHAALTGDNTACAAQGWAIQFLLMVSVLWGAIQATNVLLIVFARFGTAELHALEPYQQLLAWGVPCAMATLPLVIDIPLPRDYLRRAYGDAAVTTLVERRGVDVATHPSAQLVDVAYRDSSPRPTRLVPSFYGDATFWCWISPVYAPYRMYLLYVPLWVCFAYTLAAYVAAGTRVLRIPWLHRLHHHHRRGNGARRYRSTASLPHVSSAAQRTYAVRAGLYSLAFFATWLGPSLDRIATLAAPVAPPFALLVLHAATAPLQGCFNALVYFAARAAVKWRQRKEATAAAVPRTPAAAAVVEPKPAAVTVVASSAGGARVTTTIPVTSDAVAGTSERPPPSTFSPPPRAALAACGCRVVDGELPTLTVVLPPEEESEYAAAAAEEEEAEEEDVGDGSTRIASAYLDGGGSVVSSTAAE